MATTLAVSTFTRGLGKMALGGLVSVRQVTYVRTAAAPLVLVQRLATGPSREASTVIPLVPPIQPIEVTSIGGQVPAQPQLRSFSLTSQEIVDAMASKSPSVSSQNAPVAAPETATRIDSVKPAQYTLPTKDTGNNDDLSGHLSQCGPTEPCVVMFSAKGGLWDKGRAPEGQQQKYINVANVETVMDGAKKRPGSDGGGTGGMMAKAELADVVTQKGGNLLIASTETLGRPVKDIVSHFQSTKVVKDLLDTAPKGNWHLFKVGTEVVINDDGKVNQDNLEAYFTSVKLGCEDDPLSVAVVSGNGKVGKGIMPGGSKAVRCAIGVGPMVMAMTEAGKKLNFVPVIFYIGDSEFRTKAGFEHYSKVLGEIREDNRKLIEAEKAKCLAEGTTFDIMNVCVKIPVFNQADSATPKFYEAARS